MLGDFFLLLLRSFRSDCCFARAVVVRLDIGDDHINTLNSHLVKLEVVRRETIVGDDNVGILLGWLDVLLKSRLRLVLVCSEQASERDLLLWLPLRVF